MRTTLPHTIPLAGDARLLSADIMANGRALVMERAADERICVRWLDESGERGPPLLSDDDNCGKGDGYDPETDLLIIALNGHCPSGVEDLLECVADPAQEKPLP